MCKCGSILVLVHVCLCAHCVFVRERACLCVNVYVCKSVCACVRAYLGT